VALVLSSTRSDRVKAARRLAGRSARERAGLFLVEGPQAVREAITWRPDGVRQLYVTPDAADRFADVTAAAAAVGVRAWPVTPEVLAAMTGDEGAVTPQGLLAVCDLVGVPPAAVLTGTPRLVAVLAEVQDPGNAGTIIRAADAAGADAVVVTEGSVDVHNPKCVRSTVGSLFHLPVVTGASLADTIAALRAGGVWVLAADGAGDTDLDDLLEVAEAGGAGLGGPVAWIFGNEGRGLPTVAGELADDVVRVPLYGHAESLNVATAATVCLYATARAQRRDSRKRE
jgi:RNA methyltransferase, TrmH family